MVELNQEAPGYTQLAQRGSWFYEAIGESAGMQGRILGFGQVYLETSKDKDGNWLDGGKAYRMRVAANPPVKQFWSVTLYDNTTRGPVITDQGAADLSSRKPDLVRNADGSVDVLFGPEKPVGSTGYRNACCLDRAQPWWKILSRHAHIEMRTWGSSPWIVAGFAV